MKSYLEQYFKGKKVFVTGHTGFKGAWLVKMLTMLGAEVRAFSLKPSYENSLFEVLQLSQLCQSVEADICDACTLEKEILSFQPDYIFHLAAQALVRPSYEEPVQTFMVNAIGTANVLNALQKLQKACVSVLITTDKVYKNNEWVYPYREEDHLGGYDPYSASKACAELIISSYRQSFFNRNFYPNHRQAIFSVRAGNVIGGGDWAVDRLIPDVIRALSKSEEIVLRNPLSIRPWQHVFEPLFAYLLVAAKGSENYLKMSDAYNIGPRSEDTLTVQQMVELALKKWGGKASYKVIQSEKQPHEAKLLKLDISRIEDELSWKPQMNAEKALEFTLDWYKTFFDAPEKMISFSENQIKEYLSFCENK